MQFGTRKADAPTSGTGNYLRNFKKGETLVRFLQEPDDWIAYREHYSKDSKSFPCTQDDTCPGCSSEIESVRNNSRKYATQVYLVKQQVVLPFRIPVSLADKVVNRMERNNGTACNRDYAVLKSGAGFDTEYDLDAEEKYEIDLADLRKKITVEIEDCFKDSYVEVWGALPGDEVPEEPKQPKVEEPKVDKPPFEQGTEESIDLTEQQVRDMGKRELRELCTKANVPWDDDDSANDLADRLINSFGS